MPLTMSCPFVMQWHRRSRTGNTFQPTLTEAARRVIASRKFWRTAGGRKHGLGHAAVVTALRKAADFGPDVLVAFDIIPAWVTMRLSVSKRIVWLGDLYHETIFWNLIYSITENKKLAIHFLSNWL